MQKGRADWPQESVGAAPTPLTTGALLVIDLDDRGMLTGSFSGDVRLLDELGSTLPLAPGTALSLQLRPGFRLAAAEALGECMKTGRPAQRMLDEKASDEICLMELRVCPRWGGTHGSPEGYCVMVRDIAVDARSTRMLDRLAQVARRTSNLVVITDASQRIEWVNEAFTRASGYALEEAIGRRPGELLQFEGTEPATIEHIRAGLNERRQVQAEILNRSRSGREYWLYLDIQPVLTAEGLLDGFVAVQTDITEERRRAQELKDLAARAEEVRAMLQAAVQALPDGFAMFSPDRRLTLYNKAYLDLHPLLADVPHGITLDALMRQELSRGEYPHARGREDAWLADMQVALADQGTWSAELELADGRWVRSVKLATAQGGIIALRSDITQLKRAERQAVWHRVAAMEASQDAIAMADDSGRLTYVNPAFIRSFGGGHPGDWIGREWWQICTKDDREVVALEAQAGLDDPGLWRGYLRAVGAGAPISHQEVSLTRTPDGALVLIAREVGELKKDFDAESSLLNLLMEIVSRYLNTPVEQVDTAIVEALGQLGSYMEADRAYICSYDWDAFTACNTHDWYADGTALRRHRSQAVPLANLTEWVNVHRANRIISIPNVEALPAADGLRKLLDPDGVKSLVAIPLIGAEGCEGFLGFHSLRKEYHYTPREEKLLGFFCDISRNLRGRAKLEVARHEATEKLRREEERRRVQEAVVQQQVALEAKLAGALLESQRLQERDRQMRMASEMLVEALRSFSETPDPADGPLHLLQQLAQAMETDCVGLLPLDDRDDMHFLGHAAWWQDVRQKPALVSYLAGRSRRLVGDLTSTPIYSQLVDKWPSTRLHWLASARVESMGGAYLLLVAGTAVKDLDQGKSLLFQRFVPLVAEALRRRDEALRSRKLEQDLQQAQKFEALGALAGGIAHEINTPMQYISDNLHFLRDSFAELITGLQRQGGAGPGQQAADADLEFLLKEIPLALEQSLNGTRRVAEIVEAVRTTTYPELAPDERFDLRNVLEHCLVVTRGSWKHDIDVSLHGDRTVPVLRGSPGQMGQVFINLTTNACDAVRAAPDGRRGAVRISLGMESGAVVVHVDDNGPGVPEALRSRIFDRYFTTKDVGKGTGRGLDICRSIVEQHGGEIGVSDSPLGGGRFTVRLPVGA